MEMRTCKRCGEEKCFDEFANAGTVKGVLYRRYICIKCWAEKNNINRNENRRRVDELRAKLSCRDCGLKDHRVIEFHHRDPAEKDMEISLMMSQAWERIEKEIAKCDALCANCHRILHYEERKAKKRQLSNT